MKSITVFSINIIDKILQISINIIDINKNYGYNCTKVRNFLNVIIAKKWSKNNEQAGENAGGSGLLHCCNARTSLRQQ